MALATTKQIGINIELTCSGASGGDLLAKALKAVGGWLLVQLLMALLLYMVLGMLSKA